MVDATVLLSGGIDSTSLVRFLAKDGFRVRGVFVDFGQSSASMERQAILSLQATLQIDTEVLVVSNSMKFGTGELVGRNAFLIFAALLLSSHKNGIIALGLHAETPYYDCSPDFLESINRLVANYTDGKTSIAAPFINWSKDDVYAYFRTLNIPLSLTYSCEAGKELACGICASCLDRMRIECLPKKEP